LTVSGQINARANAVITARKYVPAAYDEPAQGPALTRIHVEESFSGDISGDGVAEFLHGTFLLQDAGAVQDNIVSGDWFVMPGSGTGKLAGLGGTGGLRAKPVEGAKVRLDYWFERFREDATC
jgi:hypothetical protein